LVKSRASKAEPINRYMFTGYSEGTVELIESDKVLTMSLFSFKNQWFVYIETEEELVCPCEFVRGDMIPFPDGKGWHRMPDIFHFSKPLSIEHWARKNKEHVPGLSIVYLRPEMISRYIFFHYQLQEERHGKCGLKYCIIFLLGNQLVMYTETPSEEDTEPYPGLLDTHNTPKDWDAAMEPCFKPWEDGFVGWKTTSKVKSI